MGFVLWPEIPIAKAANQKVQKASWLQSRLIFAVKQAGLEYPGDSKVQVKVQGGVLGLPVREVLRIDKKPFDVLIMPGKGVSIEVLYFSGPDAHPKETFAYQVGDDVSAVAISADGELVFGSLYYGKGKIWQAKTGQEVSEVGHFRTTITSAKFSPNKQKLLTGFTARRVVMWDVNSGKSEKQWRAKSPLFWRPSGLVVSDVAFAGNTNAVNVFSNGLVYWW